VLVRNRTAQSPPPLPPHSSLLQDDPSTLPCTHTVVGGDADAAAGSSHRPKHWAEADVVLVNALCFDADTAAALLRVLQGAWSRPADAAAPPSPSPSHVVVWTGATLTADQLAVATRGGAVAGDGAGAGGAGADARVCDWRWAAELRFEPADGATSWGGGISLHLYAVS
jgi:hypothetical protein